MEIVILGLIAIVSLWIWTDASAKKKRKAALMKKYGDAEIVKRVLRRMFWVTQTEEQLLDSLGKPHDIEQKVLKTKVKEIWKYNPVGKNRYGLRITLEDYQVVGWSQK